MVKRAPGWPPIAGQAQDDLFHTLMEQAADGIFIIEPDGRFVMVNSALCELLGYTREELLSLTGHATYDPDDPVTFQQRVDALQPGQRRRYERLARRKDGSLIPVEMNATTLADGRIQAIVRDMTAHKIAEAEREAERAAAQEALARQERFLRQVIDADPNMIFVKDWHGNFLLVNRALAELYGTTPDAIVGKTDGHFNASSEEVEHFVRDDRDVMMSGKPKFIAEEPVTDTRTGEQRWFQTIKVPLFAPDGGSRQLLGVATEITHRRSLEAQLLQAQKMEAVGRLAGGVAHDFNNLLTVIMGSAQLMALGLPADDPQRRDLDEIANSADRAAGLTKQLLAFSRQQVIEPRLVNVNEIVTGISKMLHRLIGEDISFAAVMQPALHAIRVDAGQLEQVLLNLAVNARDAMPKGGHLTIETQNVELDAGYANTHAEVQPGPHVMIAVSDSGVGMDEATKARIFEPFFTTKELGKGTGLGLATVYGIVRQSGGFIWVYSEPGRGATFKLYFPAVDGPTDRVVDTALTPPASRGNETVLLVEDDAAVRLLTQRIFTTAGFRVLEAADPAAALEVAAGYAGPVHLLVTDIVMPGIGGRELAKRLAVTRPAMQVLYVSGYTDDAIVRHGNLEPGLAFLQKPFTPAALLRRAREVLDR